MRVLKFGGTSVKDVESFGHVKQIITRQKQENGRLIVVASAMGGVTNQLLQMAADAVENKNFDEQLKEIEQRHLAVIHHFIPAKHQNPVIMQVKLFLNELEDLLRGVKAVKELSPKTKDSIVSYGELCSNLVLAGVLGVDFPDAEFVDARKLVVTDDRFGRARVKTKETEQCLIRYFDNSTASVSCVTGFIGADAQGQTTTLGRGGSDYTAAILGSDLGADEIQIWTDVDGFMTADPRIVKEAYSLPEITYTEAKELSYFGAKVIYPPTMVPAFAKKIPIRICNTFNEDFPGTIIHNDAKNKGDLVRGITSIKEVNLVNIQGSSLVGNTGFSGRLFSLLSRKEINIVLITQASSEHSITFAISPEDADKAEKALNAEFEMELMAAKIDPPEIVKDLAIVAIVGEKMKRIVGISGRFFNALGNNGINIIAIAQGSSEYNISAVIDKNDLGKALNVVHEEFFLPGIRTLNIFYIGTGNIGKTLLKQIAAHEKTLLKVHNLRIKLRGIANSKRMLFKPEGFEITDWESLFNEGGEKADLQKFVKKMKALNLPNSVFIDNSASTATVSFYEGIFRSKIAVVTCNKIGNSGSYKQYEQFRKAIRESGVDFYYETNVGAGLPIISTLKDLLISGDSIHRIEAVLSGTISYIFNNFKGDRHFYEIVKEAQQKGFTEPDPRDDLSGLDFARKMLILARDSGYPVEMDEIELEALLPQSCLQAADVDTFYEELKKADLHFEALKEKAASENKVLRYIGVLADGKVTIALKAIDAAHPFYNLSGSDNIIAFTTDRYKEDYPLVIKGPGAGAEVTAAGVFADLMRIGNKK